MTQTLEAATRGGHSIIKFALKGRVPSKYKRMRTGGGRSHVNANVRI